MSKIILLGDKDSRSIFRGSSIAFGVFDGVHAGHQFLLGEARRSAEATNGASIALTFSIDPDEMFSPSTLIKLMSNEERIEALSRSGVDAVAVLPFDRKLAQLNPEEFLEWTFAETAPTFVHVGKGFRFGAGASGSTANMLAWGSGRGLLVCEHSLLEMCGAPVSSTRIRSLLADGRDDEAEKLLGRSVRSA